METETDMRAVIDALGDAKEPVTISIAKIAPETATVVLVPKAGGGFDVVDPRPYVEPRLERPERRRGIAVLTTLESFIGHANRFKTEHSAVFADDTPTKPSLTAVLDYHELTAAGRPAFGEHRGRYDFPISDELTFWRGVHGRSMEQRAFADLLEDRVTDVVEPGAVGDVTRDLATELGITLAGRASLRSLSKGISVHVESKVTNRVNPDTGEAALLFEETHGDGQGQQLKIPNGFVIAIPMFRGGVSYALPVRLRYRVAGQKVSWVLELHRAEQTFREAFEEACGRAQQETDLPLLYGKPEA